MREIVDTGEATKVDFKSVWSIASGTEKAELAKDIQAFANTYDTSYRNHGFIIVGAAPGNLLYTVFSMDVDNMQAAVDQIVREHVGPFIPTQVRQFGSGAETWGVIVVPPSRNAPHIVMRDSAKQSRGDIYVRVGTTTAKAEPADFARFYRVQLEDHTFEIREQLRDLQREVTTLKAREVTAAASPGSAAPTPAASTDDIPVVPVTAEDDDLVRAVKRRLRKVSNPVSKGLYREADKLRAFLDSKEIAWDLNNITKESGRAVIDSINAQAEELWRAVALLVEGDDAGSYDDDILSALALLAFDPEPPAGTSYTGFGTGIRLYPLVTALYIIFVIGVRKKKYQLLKRVMSVELSPKWCQDAALPIGTALFYVRRASEVFQAMRADYPNQRWCDSVGNVIEIWMSGHLATDVPALERSKQFFHIGEFLLSLLGAAAPNIQQPASGRFYFTQVSVPVITKFLRTERAGLETLFGKDLNAVLERFDAGARQIALSGGCWGDGFQGGAAALVFPRANVVAP